MQCSRVALRGIAVSSASRAVARVINNLCASINKLLLSRAILHSPDILSLSKSLFHLSDILNNNKQNDELKK